MCVFKKDSFFKFVNVSNGKFPTFPFIFNISKFVNLVISSGKARFFEVFPNLFLLSLNILNQNYLNNPLLKILTLIDYQVKVKFNLEIVTKFVRVNFFKLTYFLNRQIF